MELSEDQHTRLKNIEETFENLRVIINTYKTLSMTRTRCNRKDMNELLNEINQLILNFVMEMQTK